MRFDGVYAASVGKQTEVTRCSANSKYSYWLLAVFNEGLLWIGYRPYMAAFAPKSFERLIKSNASDRLIEFKRVV